MTETFSETHPGYTSFLLTTAGLCGFIINVWILFKVVWQNVFGRSFGWIWVSRGIAYCCSSLCFVLVLGPGYYFFPEAFDVEFGIKFYAYHIALISTTLSILSNLLIAANRCLLISIPFTYKDVFSERKTLIYIAITWIVSAASIILPFWIPQCANDLVGEGQLLFSTPSLQCAYVFQLSVFVAIWFAVMATMIADFFAIYKLRKMSKIRDVLTNQSENDVLKRNRERQLSMCYMIVVQSILNPLTMISLCLGSAVPDLLLSFLCTEFLWATVDTIDGIVVIFFNENMRTFNSFQPHSVHT
ncbi:hypothetical protein L596_012548 [Steinernema carpocapsae]|uniref:G-protein coupled receptors family 1 profile domain-containing protein n=1 Tax=Steinernema carpocapsae TaxID=34508 RepID=A0A4U5NXR3_STECR|nr:hypothetical protein L596_012548 [Steinernema carpocapsae]